MEAYIGASADSKGAATVEGMELKKKRKKKKIIMMMI